MHPLPEGSHTVAKLVSQRRRSLGTALVLALTGFAATAFGLAVNAPVPGALAARVVSEWVAPLDVQAQLEVLASHTINLYRSGLTRAGDSPASILGRLNVVDADALAFLRRDPLVRPVFDGRAGKSLSVRTDSSGRLLELVARFAPLDGSRSNSHFSRLRVELVGDRLLSTVETAALAPRIKVASGSIVSSLFAATDVADVPDSVASQMAEVLSGDLDFHRDLRKGDTFSLVYEVSTADGEPVTWSGGAGRLVAAEFVNTGRRHTGVW